MIKLVGRAAEIHEKLWQSWSELRWSLDSYLELFRGSDARQMLDHFGRHVFVLYIWPTLWDDLIVQLSRLTDRPVMGKHKNISIERLVDFCGEDDGLRADIESAVDDARRVTASSREVRNKIIAHADEEQALRGSRIGPQTVKEITECVDAIYNVLERFDSKRLDRPTGNEVLHEMRAGEFVCNLKTASHAVEYISDHFTDPDGHFAYTRIEAFMESLDLEYDPQVDVIKLMNIWKLGRGLPPSCDRPTSPTT